MKQKISILVVFSLLICGYINSETNYPKSLLVDGYDVIFMPQLIQTPEDGPDYAWTCAHIYIRQSDRRIGFCQRNLKTICPPTYRDIYITIPSGEYPLLAVKNDKGFWGFYCIAYGGPSKVDSRFKYNLVYKCVFDEIDIETLEEPFKDGKARVKYNGRWITISLMDDIVNSAHGINDQVVGFNLIQQEVLKLK